MATETTEKPQPGPSSGPLALEALNVTKQFGGLTAVSDVTFNVPERSIVSIIGPNGAGKTTFFNMLTGFYKPTLGKTVNSSFGTTIDFPSYNFLIFGVLLVLMMLFRREGLIPETRTKQVLAEPERGEIESLGAEMEGTAEHEEGGAR